MAKLKWEISRPGYGVQGIVIAPTRSIAIGKAESEWLAATSYEEELVGHPDEDGKIFQRSPIPEFVANKLGRH